MRCGGEPPVYMEIFGKLFVKCSRWEFLYRMFLWKAALLDGEHIVNVRSASAITSCNGVWTQRPQWQHLVFVQQNCSFLCSTIHAQKQSEPYVRACERACVRFFLCARACVRPQTKILGLSIATRVRRERPNTGAHDADVRFDVQWRAAAS
jgi:hypothetical protein